MKLLTIFFLLLFKIHTVAQQHYQLVDLQANTAATFSVAYGINEKGVITGSSSLGFYIWQDNQMEQISSAGYISPIGFDLNDIGEVAGTLKLSNGISQRAFFYNSAYSLQSIFPGTLNGAEGYDINNFDHIVGNCWTNSADTARHAVIWVDGQITDLGTLPGGIFSGALAINNLDQVTGNSNIDGSSITHAFLHNGSMIDLGVLSGFTNSFGQGINNQGWVVGYSQSPGVGEATLWMPGSQPIGLGKLQGGTFSDARAINDSGIIVGRSSTTGTQNFRACVWINDTLKNLNGLTILPPGWVLTEARDINNEGQIVGIATFNNQNRAFLLNPFVLSISSPDSGELVMADEFYNIRWNSLGIDSIRIEFSLDGGSVYNLIDEINPDEGIYTWLVPDTLSAKCKIRLTDINDTTRRSTSTLFKIKGYELTRFKADGNYEFFGAQVNSWNFSNSGEVMWPESWWNEFNYENGNDPFTQQPYPDIFTRFPIKAKPSDFPSWPIFVETFGEDQCYWVNGNRKSYSHFALYFWFFFKNEYGGSCSGFATSSLLAFDDPVTFQLTFPEVGNFEHLHDLTINNDRRKVNAKLYTSVMGWEHNIYYRQVYSKTPRETLQELKDMFLEEIRHDKWLGVTDSLTGSAHAVVPVKLKKINETGLYSLYVYDSNCPNCPLEVPEIIIDSLANTWIFVPYEWGSYYDFILLDPVSSYLTQPKLWAFWAEEISKPLGLTLLRFFNSGDADIVITDSSGNSIGFQDSFVINNIIDAAPIIPRTSNFNPPIGYIIPDGKYKVEINSTGDSLSSFMATSRTRMFSYWRSDLVPGQTDILSFNDDISFKNPDNISKNINFQSIIRHDTTGEKSFQFNNCEFVLNDSAKLFTPDDVQLKFINFGPEKNYDLSIEIGSTNAIANFEHNNLSLPANTSHTIAPNWEDLQNQPVKIYIDLGNNGSVDDSLIVENQATGIDENQFVQLPGEFMLEQNYPNPFNPTTKIKFSIPKSSFVNLVVYDILGNEVATLVNEEKEIGIYEIEFNASELSSGVYFYRLTTENFVQSKKMIYLK